MAYRQGGRDHNMAYKEIEIGGQKRGALFSQGTLILARDATKEYSDEEKAAFGWYIVIWAALKAACVINRTVCDFTLADVIGWADKLTPETLTDLSAMNAENNGFEPDQDEAHPEMTDEEKKSTTELIEQPVTDSPVS